MRAGLRRAFTVWRSRFSRSPGFLSREAQLLANLGFAERLLANEHAINHAVQPDANSST